MKIERLNAQALEQYVQSESFRTMPVVPISRHRALSQVRNPRLEADDVVLLLATEDGELRGYLGVLPDQFHSNGQSLRMGWLSCLWVDPTQRGKGIARKLVEAALEAWGGQIAITEFTPEAEQLYLKTGQFGYLTKITGMRGYLRFDLQHLLPRKEPKLAEVKPLLQAADGGLNVLHDFTLHAWEYKQRYGPTTATVQPAPDAEAWEFISRYASPTLTKRTRKELEWALNHPWLVPGLDTEGYGKRYHFSAIDRDFRQYTMVIRNGEELEAVLLFTQRHDALKLNYHFHTLDDLQEVLRHLKLHMIRERLHTFTTFHPELSKALKKLPAPFYLVRPVERKYLVTNRMKEKLEPEEVAFQAGDADAFFT